MYLDICGDFEYDGKFFTAQFNPQLCNIEFDCANIPTFIIMEGLTQLACRVASRTFFDHAPCFPAMINHFEFKRSIDGILLDENSLVLMATAEKKNNFVAATCSLVDQSHDPVAFSEIWVTKRQPLTRIKPKTASSMASYPPGEEIENR